MRITSILLAFCCLLLSQAGWAQPGAGGQAGSIAVAADRGQITYYAQAGDTLSSIAQRLTTRAGNWVALGKLNRISRDVAIPIGTAIVIPAELLPDEPAEARIVAFSGSVAASGADGAALKVAVGTVLREGASLETGANSFLTLALADQSRISLPSNSRIGLARLRVARHTGSPRTEIAIRQGRVEARVAPLNLNKGRFEVHSPQSVTGVRGTHFRVALADGRVGHEVLGGSVALSRPGNAASLLLRQGQGALVGAGQEPVPIALLPAPQLAGTPGAAGGKLRIDLLPVAGASAYQVQIATDAEGQNVIAESRGAGPRIDIPGLADGAYFAHVSAIDRFGLQGPSLASPFRLAGGEHRPPPARAAAPKALPAMAAPYVDGSDRDRLWLRWNGAPGQRFLVQVARDPGFTWLLLSATTERPEIRLTRPAFGTYYARVQVLHAGDRADPFSLAQAFVVTDHWILHDGAPFVVGATAGRGAH